MEVHPNPQGLNSEDYWWVYRSKVVEEHFFDSEIEARNFVAANPRFAAEPPVKKPVRARDKEGR